MYRLVCCGALQIVFLVCKRVAGKERCACTRLTYVLCACESCHCQRQLYCIRRILDCRLKANTERHSVFSTLASDTVISMPSVRRHAEHQQWVVQMTLSLMSVYCRRCNLRPSLFYRSKHTVKCSLQVVKLCTCMATACRIHDEAQSKLRCAHTLSG